MALYPDTNPSAGDEVKDLVGKLLQSFNTSATNAVKYVAQTLTTGQKNQAKTNIGIGTAGSLDVGTTANTVMAGDDSRVTRFVYDVAAADQTVNGSATPVDSEIAIPLTVGKWFLDIMMVFDTPTTPGARACFTFDGTIAILSGTTYHEFDNTIGAYGLFPSVGTNWIGAGNATTRAGAVTSIVLRVRATYNVTVAGTLTLQFAQSVSNASNTVLKAGSNIQAAKLA